MIRHPIIGAAKANRRLQHRAYELYKIGWAAWVKAGGQPISDQPRTRREWSQALETRAAWIAVAQEAANGRH